MEDGRAYTLNLGNNGGMSSGIKYKYPMPTAGVASSDPISAPEHYRAGGAYETRKVIEAWGLNYYLGNVVKYISRHGRKPGARVLEDLAKARQYLEFEIDRLEGLERDGDVR